MIVVMAIGAPLTGSVDRRTDLPVGALQTDAAFIPSIAAACSCRDRPANMSDFALADLRVVRACSRGPALPIAAKAETAFFTVALLVHAVIVMMAIAAVHASPVFGRASTTIRAMIGSTLPIVIAKLAIGQVLRRGALHRRQHRENTQKQDQKSSRHSVFPLTSQRAPDQSKCGGTRRHSPLTIVIAGRFAEDLWFIFAHYPR